MPPRPAPMIVTVVAFAGWFMLGSLQRSTARKARKQMFELTRLGEGPTVRPRRYIACSSGPAPPILRGRRPWQDAPFRRTPDGAFVFLERDAMIELLERQRRLTVNQWKLICTANLADLLDFFDLFLIGYVTAALTKEWSLTYWQGGAILMASGIGAPLGAYFCGWLGDRFGRRNLFIASSITISIATGLCVFTPGPAALIPGWLFLVIMRVFVGVGNAGIYTIDLPLVQEFIPAYKRGWVSALVTTMLPAGSLLAGFVGWQLLPLVGWRGLFLVGLVPLVLVFMIRYWVPESPRWLMRMGRIEEARRSLAWALMVDPQEITLPADLEPVEKTRWLELFKYPRLVAAGCLTGLT